MSQQMPSFISSQAHSHSSLQAHTQPFIFEHIFANFSLHIRQSVNIVAPIIIKAPICIPKRQVHEHLLFDFLHIKSSFLFCFYFFTHGFYYSFRMIAKIALKFYETFYKALNISKYASNRCKIHLNMLQYIREQNTFGYQRDRKNSTK